MSARLADDGGARAGDARTSGSMIEIRSRPTGNRPTGNRPPGDELSGDELPENGPVRFDLAEFSLSDVVRLGARLRAEARAAADFADACRRVVGCLCGHVVDAASGRAAFAVVQVVVDGEIRAAAGDLLDPAGVRPLDRSDRAGFHPDDLFHVEYAIGSPLLPQEFVLDQGVRSVIGFGGELADGERFTVIAFSRTHIDAELAEMFRALAVNVRLGLLDQLHVDATAREAAYAHLLAVLESTATSQALRLEDTVAELSEATGRLRHSQRELRQREARLREESSLVEQLHTVGTDLAAELDLDRVVQRATDVATDMTGAAFGAFFYNVYDDLGESYVLYALSGVPRAAFERFPMPRNTGVFEPTFRGTAIVRSDDITQDLRYGRTGPHFGIPEGHLPVRSYLAVPAISPTGEVLGGFFFGHPQAGRFTDRHERIAIGIAAQTAVAMDNARMYRRQRTAAVELQRSLLPRIPAIAGLEIVSRYLPAATGVEVGGDWVDAVPLSAGRVALVVGDVMGKGIHAAAVMGQLRTAIRAYAALDLPPGRLMRHVNATILQDLDAEMATCLYLVHDPVEQTICWANAGHLPPATVVDGGQARLLEGPVGPPLGIDEYPYVEHSVPMPVGEALLLYTDGLVERRDRGLDEGLKNLVAALADRAVPTDESVDGLIDAMVDADRHDDDIAVLYVRQSPTELPATARQPFSATAASSRQARKFAEQVAQEWHLDGQIDTVITIVNELVSNAAQHARTRHIELRLHRLAGRFAVEVFDQDNRMPFLIEAESDDERHRGLHIVRASADRWGTRAVSDGKIVWAELNVVGKH